MPPITPTGGLRSILEGMFWVEQYETRDLATIKSNLARDHGPGAARDAEPDIIRALAAKKRYPSGIKQVATFRSGLDTDQIREGEREVAKAKRKRLHIVSFNTEDGAEWVWGLSTPALRGLNI